MPYVESRYVIDIIIQKAKRSNREMMMMMLQSSILPSTPKLPILKSSSSIIRRIRCSSSVCVQSSSCSAIKPSPAEVSRTIMELSSVGTFSTAPQDTCPLSVGVRFAVDPEDGTPIVCLHQHLAADNNNRASLNVHLHQCGGLQCTIQGSLHRPQQQHHHHKSLWENRFGEKAEAEFIHLLHVDRVLQMDNFMEDGVWVTSSEYTLAAADPLRDFAHHLVHEINTHHMEDVVRFCNIYVDSDVQVSQAKMVWVDRLGFDIHIYSPENEVFQVRIPFPRGEVTNEKAAKSSFNGMSQLAWEVEKNYHPLQFHKIKHLKKIAAKLSPDSC